MFYGMMRAGGLFRWRELTEGMLRVTEPFIRNVKTLPEPLLCIGAARETPSDSYFLEDHL